MCLFVLLIDWWFCAAECFCDLCYIFVAWRVQFLLNPSWQNYNVNFSMKKLCVELICSLSNQLQAKWLNFVFNIALCIVLTVVFLHHGLRVSACALHVADLKTKLTEGLNESVYLSHYYIILYCIVSKVRPVAQMQLSNKFLLVLRLL